MPGYYARKLSGRRLEACYALAPPRVRQYLEAEIVHVLARLRPDDTVLELGCGYGRVAMRLAAAAARVVGIDTAAESVALAHARGAGGRCVYVVADAVALPFGDACFDAVVCVQNGVCAFGVDQADLLREAVRVARPGGRVLLSSYAAEFWPDRLRWFELQAAAGLVGEPDRERTGRGVIVCRDGFRAGSCDEAAFLALCRGLGLEPTITTVDGSSVFCEVAAAGRP